MDHFLRLSGLLFLGLCLAPVAVAQAVACNEYAPADATRSGTLTGQVFPRPARF
jgi:hypothetical protein